MGHFIWRINARINACDYSLLRNRLDFEIFSTFIAGTINLIFCTAIASVLLIHLAEKFFWYYHCFNINGNG